MCSGDGYIVPLVNPLPSLYRAALAKQHADMKKLPKEY